MTDEHIDVDARISQLAEMLYRVISDPRMLRDEKVREAERLTGRMLWWDAHRDLAHNLDVLADAAAAPGVETHQ